MSFKKSFFKNISTFALYNYIAQGFEFFSTIILSRLLLPEEYGFVAIIAIFSGFIQLFSTLGIGTSVIRSDYGYTFHKHLYNLAIWLGFALTLTMMLLSLPIALFFGNKALIVPTLLISFKFLFDSLTYVPFALLTKQLKFNLVGIAKLAGVIFQISLTIILAYLGFSYWSLIIPLIFGPLVQYIFLRNKVDVKISFYGWRATRRIAWKIRSLMGNLSLNNLVSYWAYQADKVVIGRLYTEADLGLYNRAFRFISLTNRLVTGIFGSVLFPSLKKLIDDGGDVQKEYEDMLRIIMLFNIPLMIILILLPETLVFYLWGNDWMGVATFLPYVGIILIYNSVTGTLGSLFMLYEKERLLLISNFINSALTIAIVIIAGFYSMMHVIRFLVLGYIFLSTPIYAYYGFYRSFGVKVGRIIQFWLPLMLFGFLLFLSVDYHYVYAQGITLFVFTLYLVYGLRNSVKEIIKTVLKKFSGKKPQSPG